jgi:hypothetical protein
MDTGSDTPEEEFKTAEQRSREIQEHARKQREAQEEEDRQSLEAARKERLRTETKDQRDFRIRDEIEDHVRMLKRRVEEAREREPRYTYHDMHQARAVLGVGDKYKDDHLMSFTDIINAHRKRMLVVHPDKGGSHEQTLEADRARDILDHISRYGPSGPFAPRNAKRPK